MNIPKIKTFISLSVVTALGVISFLGINYLKNSNLIDKVQAAAETINTLNYFVSKNPSIELVDVGGSLGQVVSGQTAYYVKFSLPTNYEKYSWDSNYIYLKEDRSGAPNAYYTFSPGMWMKRSMKVGEKIVVANNAIVNYSNCSRTTSSTFPYTMTLEQHIPNYNAGGDLGTQDVIVLKYDYYGDFERFYYSNKWGWIKWQLVDSKGVVKQESVFNKILKVKPTFSSSLTCAKCVSTTIPTKIAPGASKTVTVTLKNVGDVSWNINAAKPYKLGSQSPQDNQVWGLGRVALPTTTNSGGTQNFTFQIKAPTTPGTYSSRWQMLQDGVMWFGDICGPTSISVSN